MDAAQLRYGAAAFGGDDHMKRAERSRLMSTLMTAAVASSLFAAPVLAQDAFTGGHASVQLTAGYGFPVQALGDLIGNPYDVSLGAQAGYTLNNGLYFGAMADYFAGDSQTVAGTRFDEQLELTYDWSHTGIDVGYDLRANQLVIRPAVSVGVAILGSCLEDVCESDGYLMVAPAISALGPLSDHAFFSFTVRYYLVPGSDSDPIDGVSFGVGAGFTL